MIKKEVLVLCNEPSQAFIERWINSDKQKDIKYLGIERTEDNRDREEFTLIYSRFDKYNNKEIVNAVVLSDVGTKNNGSCFFGGLSLTSQEFRQIKSFIFRTPAKPGDLVTKITAPTGRLEAIENKYLAIIQKKNA